MKPIILQLFSEGDYLLKEAKSNFFIQEDNQCDAICKTSMAIKKYLDAYEVYLFENVKATENYHILLHVIIQKDPNFINYSGKIYEVKCFADESKANSEGFFLYPDEVNKILKNIVEMRTYIAHQIDIEDLFLTNHTETSFMTT